LKRIRVFFVGGWIPDERGFFNARPWMVVPVGMFPRNSGGTITRQFWMALVSALFIDGPVTQYGTSSRGLRERWARYSPNPRDQSRNTARITRINLNGPDPELMDRFIRRASS